MDVDTTHNTDTGVPCKNLHIMKSEFLVYRMHKHRFPNSFYSKGFRPHVYMYITDTTISPFIVNCSYKGDYFVDGFLQKTEMFI